MRRRGELEEYKTGKAHINLTLRPLLATIVAAEKQ